jgi:hypothetical protein
MANKSVDKRIGVVYGRTDPTIFSEPELAR